jgi:hypothetical protein
MCHPIYPITNSCLWHLNCQGLHFRLSIHKELATKILDLKDDILGIGIKVKQAAHACMEWLSTSWQVQTSNSLKYKTFREVPKKRTQFIVVTRLVNIPQNVEPNEKLCKWSSDLLPWRTSTLKPNSVRT